MDKSLKTKKCFEIMTKIYYDIYEKEIRKINFSNLESKRGDF